MPDAQPDIVIRASCEPDVPAMLAIYRFHVTQGIGDLGAYVDEPMREDDLKQRRKNMKKKRLPHLVADVGGVVAGYAYAVPFRKRPAYRFALKHSIYIHHEYLRSGIGRRLLPALIDACAKAGYFQLIGYIDSANEASLKLHTNCGFRQVGLLQSVGFKYGHWTDTVMVQRALVDDPAAVPGPWPKIEPSPL
jgi:phosphinothricin acetyltransferase